MTLDPKELDEEIDEFVESLFREHDALPKRMVAGALENKAHELYDEDDAQFDN